MSDVKYRQVNFGLGWAVGDLVLELVVFEY